MSDGKSKKGSAGSAKGGRPRKRYGWRKPRWRDGLFWIAVALSAALIGLQVYFNDRASFADWGALAIRGIVTYVLISAILRIRRGMPTALVDGFNEAEAKAKAKPNRQSTAESVARTSGRTVGRAVAAYKRAQQKD